MATNNLSTKQINEKGLDAQEIPLDTRQREIYEQAQGYVYPKSEAVRETLEWFMDQKFGLMIHWGL